MQLSELRQRLRVLNANPAHESHVLRRWAQARPIDSGSRRIEHYLPKVLRDALPALMRELDSLARLQVERDGADGSARLLIALQDGQTIEAVRLAPTGKASGLCISSQVGCAVGCVFCMTGTMGLVRQLSSAEIVAQVALARRTRPVQKVVFMGMGEPAHNLDAVMEAIDLLGREGGIGHKNLVLSTVGDTRLLDRLDKLRVDEVRPALALSLHTMDNARRALLLPRAPRIPIDALLNRADSYARASGYPLQIQWTLLAGINDGDGEVEALVAGLRGRRAVLNMIPYNQVTGLAHERPTSERCTQLFRTLNQRGVFTRLRQSAGQDIEAGCGQLRSRANSQRPVDRTYRIQMLEGRAGRS